MADYLSHNYAPQAFEFELSPGATFMFRDHSRVRVHGWMAGSLGNGAAAAFLREADQMWGATDPNHDTPRSRWLATFGRTDAGPRLASIGGYDNFSEGERVFRIRNQRRPRR